MSKSMNYEEATWLKKTQAEAACGLGCARPGPRVAWVACDLGGALPRRRATWAARDLGSSLPGRMRPRFLFSSSSSFSSVFFSDMFWVLLYIYKGYKTRFPCGRHMEKYATLDHIRPWKSSFKDSIYRPKLSFKDSIYKPKSSLIDLRC